MKINNKAKILLQCVYNFTNCSVTSGNESVSHLDYIIYDHFCVALCIELYLHSNVNYILEFMYFQCKIFFLELKIKV